jgi:glycosyltransferase involved in cell wall biosynthesis
MGKVVPIGNADALAAAILEILAEPQNYRRDSAAIARAYDPDAVAVEYEKLSEKPGKW